MTINDSNDLADFARSQGGTITPAKLRAMRIVAGQTTDIDLQQILTHLYEDLTSFAGWIVTEMRLAESWTSQYYLDIKVAPASGQGRALLTVTPANLDWTLTRAQPSNETWLRAQLELAFKLVQLQESVRRASTHLFELS
jgi:hypothetical protein